MEDHWLVQRLMDALKELEESPMTDDDLAKFKARVLELARQAEEGEE